VPIAPELPPRSDAVVDIVGSETLVHVKSDNPNPLPSFVEIWAQEAGVDPQDPRILYTFTGDTGGMAMFCRLREPLTAAELRTDVAVYAETDPVRQSGEYALRNLPYIYDASAALLTRRPTADEAQRCSGEGIDYLELPIGITRCAGQTCPVVALVKRDRLNNPILARLVEVIAADPGLLGNTTALALAGITPLQPAQADRIRSLAGAAR
jgi:hypothetical protein